MPHRLCGRRARRGRCVRRSHRGRRDLRAARRRHHHHQGPVRRRRRSDAGRLEAACTHGKPAAASAAGRQAAHRRGRGDRRQDQHDRVRLLRRSAPIRITARRAIRRTARAFPAARLPAAPSPLPTTCARSRSAATPAARRGFLPRSAASSASSRRRCACRSTAPFRCPLRSIPSARWRRASPTASTPTR